MRQAPRDSDALGRVKEVLNPLSALHLTSQKAGSPRYILGGMKADDLNESVVGLYAAFAGYPLRPHIESCPCCRGPQDTRQLPSKPLQELSADDLRLYAFRAMTTVGDVDDFRHVLPRILELLPHDFPVDKEVVLGKLKYAGWDHWPPTERAAVKRYLSDAWAWARHNAPDPYRYIPAEIGSWLSAIARAESDLTSYLAAWESDTNSEASENLQRFLSDYSAELDSDESPGAYWDDAVAQWDQVKRWARRIEATKSS
jgi:hypothetical protein